MQGSEQGAKHRRPSFCSQQTERFRVFLYYFLVPPSLSSWFFFSPLLLMLAFRISPVLVRQRRLKV